MNDVHDGALYAPPFGSHHVRDLALYDVPGTNPFLSFVYVPYGTHTPPILKKLEPVVSTLACNLTKLYAPLLLSHVNVAFVEFGVVTAKLPTFGQSASVVKFGPLTHAVAPVEQYHTLICHS